MMGLWIMRIVYRSRIIHQDRIPEDGGAVIVSNHVTYGDALFLSLICPRPIRFIVAEKFVAIRWLGWILELFNCLPISSRNPRESLSKAIQALKAGEVICIFPEGQLTRTGTLCAARRGLEMLAKIALPHRAHLHGRTMGQHLLLLRQPFLLQGASPRSLPFHRRHRRAH